MLLWLKEPDFTTIQQVSPSKDMPTMFVSNAIRLILGAKPNVMLMLKVMIITQKSWFVVVVRMYPEPKCAPNMVQITWNTNADTAVLWRYFSVLVRPIFAMLVMMISNE
jgi:hypothetical protein